LHEDNANGVADENYRKWLEDQTIVPGVPVEKDAWVVNTGKNSAYVRVKVSVPDNLNPVWASDLAQNWIIADTAKGTDATVYTLKYNRVLPAGGNTSDFLTAIVMDEYYNDQSKTAFNVIINVEAIQADGFADAAAAFSALDAQLKVNGGDVVAYVENAAALKDALAAGKVVALTEDLVDAPVATTAPYGNLYGFHVKGGVFDGMGNTVDFEDAINNAGTNDNYGFMVSGGTIKNVSVLGVFRGIMIMSPTEDIVLDNVKVGGEGVCYAINTGEGDFTKNLTVTNSTIAGWTSLSNIKSASFTNCDFEQGGYYTTEVYGRVVKPYVNTVFENCDFTTAYNIDLSSLRADCKVTFINCTVNGQPLTADMFTIPTTDAEYENCIISVDLPSGRTLADCVIIK
jgi:hypothetical protein